MIYTIKGHSGKLLSLAQPQIMGILNATPDSFFTKGIKSTTSELVDVAGKMIEDGASILDIGGMSTRPGSTAISEQEELDRVLPVLEAIRQFFPSIFISIDTYRSKIAEESIIRGADIINDISAGDLDEAMIPTIAKYGATYLMMHMKGTPQNMQDNPNYEDILNEIMFYFIHKINVLRQHNIHDIILDVGFGFGKTVEDNFKILKHLSGFQSFEYPLLAGISRKSMFQKLLNITPEQALNATTVGHVIALQQGAHLLRVHDVKEAKEAINILNFLQNV